MSITVNPWLHPFFRCAKKQRWKWALSLKESLALVDGAKFNPDRVGWERALEHPLVRPAEHVVLNTDVIRLGSTESIDEETRGELETCLRLLIPWRKGPFCVYGTHIETEWRSDFKWARVLPHIQSLAGRTVLDVGCGSGYHMLRMVGEGAKFVVGIDPSQLFWTQFQLLRTISGVSNAYFLPLKLASMPANTMAFDTVFSMGVLYHRMSPLEHLDNLRKQLRPNGEIVLETIVVEGEEGYSLVPEYRYASMNNVWFLPSVATLIRWLRRVGFMNIRCVDVTKTSTAEQRQTDWMPFNSLNHFLDPKDSRFTIEGYPAPLRATIIAQRK